MQIESIRHKALRQLIEAGQVKGLNPNIVARLRKMIAYLIAIEKQDELRIPPNWGAHELTGDRAGEWSLVVTKNWRLTFRLTDDNRVEDLDLEDYH